MYRSKLLNNICHNKFICPLFLNSLKSLSISKRFHSKQQFYLQRNLNFAIKYVQTKKEFHTNDKINQKLRVETENIHVYQIMQCLPIYQNNLASENSKDNLENVTKLNEFESLLNKHYRTQTASEILKTFKKVCHFSKINNITLADNRFDNLVDGLMDNCQNLTDDELKDLLFCINQFPKTPTIDSHNFHDIWSALDDTCCNRIQNWSIKKSLLFADYWYLLGLSKYCEYSIQTIKKVCRKVKNLSAAELVQSLFYINVCRIQWSMFEFEVRLEECINELTLNEMAITSMAFFKTQVPFKGTFVTSYMIGKLLENVSTVHEITLTAILKIVRYSPHISLVDQITELFNRLVPEIDRLSILCCVHIALLGTNTQLFHQEILQKICEKFVKNLSTARLKDLERFIFVLTLFNFNPKTTPDIFEAVLLELKKPERIIETEKHPRCLPCTLHYLGLKQIYPTELIDKVLDPNFISKAYGNNKQKIGREILFLDQSLEIDCKNYTGHRIDKKLRRNLTKWSADWIPTRNQKFRLTAADKLMLDIIDVLEVVHGKNNYIHIDYILPHFPKPDIIICKNNVGNPVEVKKYFEKYKLGDIMQLQLTNELVFYAIIVGGWNMFLRGTEIPVATLATKIRQLKKIGYVPVLVPWSAFLHLSRLEKEKYLQDRIQGKFL